MVDMCERALTKALSRTSFDGIATAAQQMALPSLKSACRRFAAEPSNGVERRLQAALRRSSDGLQFGEVPVPQPVVELLAPPAAGATSGQQPANKKRRSY